MTYAPAGLSRRPGDGANSSRRSVIAHPDGPNSDAGVRSTTFAAPLATRAPFAKPVVTMPAAGPALAGSMVAMNLNHVVTEALRCKTQCCGRGARNRCRRCKQYRSTYRLQRSSHSHLLE